MDALSDNALMLKVKAGDLDRLGLLFERHHRKLYSFFYRLTSSGAVSEDLVQNVFMRMLTYKHAFTGEGKFTTWMYHLARNVHADHYRINKRLGFANDFSEYAETISDGSDLEAQTRKNEEIKLLEKAMQLLDLEKREVLVLSRYQEMKYKEIATLLNCSEGAVKVKVFRAMNELKSIYSRLERQECI